MASLRGGATVSFRTCERALCSIGERVRRRIKYKIAERPAYLLAHKRNVIVLWHGVRVMESAYSTSIGGALDVLQKTLHSFEIGRSCFRVIFDGVGAPEGDDDACLQVKG